MEKDGQAFHIDSLFFFSASSLVLERGCLVGILQASFTLWQSTNSFIHLLSRVFLHLLLCLSHAPGLCPRSVDGVNCASALRFC